MKKRVTGPYVKASTRHEPFTAFVPHPLPPQPPIILDATLEKMHGEAQVALGRLDATAACRINLLAGEYS